MRLMRWRASRRTLVVAGVVVLLAATLASVFAIRKGGSNRSPGSYAAVTGKGWAMTAPTGWKVTIAPKDLPDVVAMAQTNGDELVLRARPVDPTRMDRDFQLLHSLEDVLYGQRTIVREGPVAIKGATRSLLMESTFERKDRTTMIIYDVLALSRTSIGYHLFAVGPQDQLPSDFEDKVVLSLSLEGS